MQCVQMRINRAKAGGKALGVALAAAMSASALAANLNFPLVPLFMSNAVSPNMMIMLDNSGSMQNVLPDAPFDESVTYLASCPVGNTVAADQDIDLFIQISTKLPFMAIRTANSGLGRAGFFFGTGIGQRCFDPAITYGHPTSGFKVRLFADASNLNFRFPSNYGGARYSGNYLNWYFGNFGGVPVWNGGQGIKPVSATASAQVRLDVAKVSASALVDGLDRRLRVGLAAYVLNPSVAGSEYFGGVLHSPIELIGAPNSVKRTSLKAGINALVGNTNTPLASTLSDIAAYFTQGYSGNLTIHPGKPAQADVSAAELFFNHSLSDPNNIGAAPPVQFSCQRNFVMLLTDGRPNRDQVISTHLADYDADCTEANGCAPPATTCAAGVVNAVGCDKKTSRSYEQHGSDYFDDVAQALREIDFRPDFPNEVGGSQFINNITSYIIGFADPQVQSDPLLNAAGDANHGGGGFYPAGNAAALNDVFRRIVSDILKRAGSAGAVSLNGSRLTAGSKVYAPSFNSGDWSGDLKGFSISTGAAGVCPTTAKGLPCPTPAFSAANLLNSQNFSGNGSGSRAILSYNRASKIGIPFRWASLTSAQQGALNANPDHPSFDSDGNGSLRLDYLRGDRSQEALVAVPGMRVRSSVLGDIVHSDPAYVAEPPFFFGFDGYAAFRASNRLRTPMVYVGANDGMLHGFDANTGAERLAYVPNQLFGVAGAPKLSRLTQKVYTHQFAVDASPVVGDAFIGTTWKSVLVSGLRSGGQGLFALDVTNPSLFSEAKTDTVMWEFDDSDDPDLGYTFSKPSIVKMANGKWAAIVGNGYNNIEADGAVSGNGRAALFIIFLDGPAGGDWTQGTDYIKLLTSEGSASDPNGLATPAAVDVNGDSVVDVIYAGDELGNLWRFDVNSTSTADWKVAYGNTPLFTTNDGSGAAANVQPITGRPEVGFNRLITSVPSSGLTNLTVYFGTGRYIDAGDNVATGQVNQSFYAIFDRFGGAASTAPSGIARTDLLQQSIVGEVNTSGGACTTGSACFRVTSNNAFTNSDGALDGKKGWYIDLVNSGLTVADNLGERQVTTPVLRDGKIIFTTLTPSANPCVFGGGGFLMELDARTGARLSKPTLDTNNDGVITDADNINVTTSADATNNFTVSGQRSEVGILSTPSIVTESAGTELKFMGGSTAGIAVVRESAAGRFGRISWREIIQ
jgi:type IV pilus assembly protein PilY1